MCEQPVQCSRCDQVRQRAIVARVSMCWRNFPALSRSSHLPATCCSPSCFPSGISSGFRHGALHPTVATFPVRRARCNLTGQRVRSARTSRDALTHVTRWRERPRFCESAERAGNDHYSGRPGRRVLDGSAPDVARLECRSSSAGTVIRVARRTQRASLTCNCTRYQTWSRSPCANTPLSR